jgi:glucosamine-6-phosphate deaminase
MRVVKVKNYSAVSKIASDLLIDEIKSKPNLVLGLATGKTQRGFYKNLIKSDIDFSKIKSFNLDEFYPIEKTSKKSLYFYMEKNFFNKVNIKKVNINFLRGNTKDPKKESKRYEDKIKKTPIDIQFLGLGTNGHIAYNEPGSKYNSRTRVVELAPSTIKDKKGPKKGLSMGIKTILAAKKIILLASGNDKAKAVKGLIEGKIGEGCPASFLRKHKDFTLIIDKKAASLL